MLECHRLFMNIKALAAIFMATLTVLEAQQCYLQKFKNVTNGNQALPRSNITSSYALGRLGECHILCTQTENCHGYNFRFRPNRNNYNSVNCQLSNSTEKWNNSKIRHGPWVYYQDVVIAEDIDECSRGINECHTNAGCSNTFGSYNCLCKNGYTGNGRTCEDIDECSLGINECHTNAGCSNTFGSYNCQCKNGYTGNGRTCKDIDECSLGINECHTNAGCSNSFGSYNCQCKNGYTGNGRTCKATILNSCADLYKSGVRQDGVYTIDPDGLGSFQVRCDMTTNGGGWTVFQRRQDGSEDFYRGWSDYKAGFGNLNGEFWLGLDKIHRLTKSGQDVLRVDLMDFNNAVRYAEYGTFSVADESDKYRLNIGTYSGDAGDFLSYHNQMQFTTKDKDNDHTNGNCAKSYKGAWWYHSCYYSNLNGLYLGAGQTGTEGIKWNNWQFSMKKTLMKTRPS